MAGYKDLITSNIKNLRIKLRLTQEKFAEKADISVDGYRALEKSRYAPQPETIDKICDAFNITPFELLLPDSENGADLINEIHCKLKLCKPEDLKRVSAMIDIIRH